MTQGHQGQVAKEQGGCCAGNKSQQSVQKESAETGCCDQKDKKLLRTESEPKSDGCCGSKK